MAKSLFTVIGCRPQFVKASALSRKFNEYKQTLRKLNETVIHTGQHYDFNMSEQFFQELEIPKPSFNCGISGGTHGENTGRMIEKIEKIIINSELDYLLVYGDTDSTLAGALAASKLSIPVFHVEAGLRSFNKNQPEEINRVLTDHLSEICFTPTLNACENLLKEGVPENKIVHVGDVMEDMNIFFSDKASKNMKFVEKHSLINSDYGLLTIHREENTNTKSTLENLLKTINQIKMRIIFPIHPRTKRKVEEFRLEKYLENLETIDPVGFVDMATLEKYSKIILTDSGGVQKEAYHHSVPCVTLRKETEWIELISSGWNKLANPIDQNEILNALEIQLKFDRNTPKLNYYGKGDTAQKIYDHITSI